MQKEVKREKRLPAFTINVDELELFYLKFIPLFNSSEKVTFYLNAEFPSEAISFHSINELKNYSEHYKKTNKFSLTLRQNDKVILILNSAKNFSLVSSPKVIALGDNEAWCAGTVETVYSFIKLRKQWFHWLAIAPIWALFMVFVPALLMVDILFDVKIYSMISSFQSLIFCLLVIVLIWIQPIAFPSSTLIFVEEDSFIKKNVAELTLFATVLALIIALLQMYLNK